MVIVDYLKGKGYKIKQVGGLYRMRCPLPGHRDSDPSFTIYPDTNSFHCFGCNTGGNLPKLMTLLGDPVPKELQTQKIVTTVNLNFMPQEKLEKRIARIMVEIRKMRKSRFSQKVLNKRATALIWRLQNDNAHRRSSHQAEERQKI